MALYLTPKAPTAVFRYGWEPALLSGDAISTATLTVSSGDGVLDSYSIEDNEVRFFLSGGTDSTVTVIAATVTTDDGETIAETIYVPINVKTQAISNTANDVCAFALRKIVGNGSTASADELTDAIERLNAKIALWRIAGMDLGVAEELTASDTLTIADGHLTALKYSLRAELHDHYGVPLSQTDYTMAREAEAIVAADLHNFSDLAFEKSLTRRTGGWDYERGE